MPVWLLMALGVTLGLYTLSRLFERGEQIVRNAIEVFAINEILRYLLKKCPSLPQTPPERARELLRQYISNVNLRYVRQNGEYLVTVETSSPEGGLEKATKAVGLDDLPNSVQEEFLRTGKTEFRIPWTGWEEKVLQSSRRE